MLNPTDLYGTHQFDGNVNFSRYDEGWGEAMKVLMNHIYEYEKGVRRMVLYTFNARYTDYAIRRLEHRHIDYILQPAGRDTVNLFFGRKECLQAIKLIVTKPLNELSPEEDFMLGAMLGYDITMECERYCMLKNRKCSCKDCKDCPNALDASLKKGEGAINNKETWVATISNEREKVLAI